MPLEREQLGQQGVIAIGIGLFCLSFYAGTIVPLAAERERLRGEDIRLTQALASAARGDQGAPDAVAQGPVSLPPVAAANDLLLKLAEAHGVAGFTVDRVAIQQTDEPGLRRIELSFPLKGTYPQLRAALHAYLRLSPVVTLDEISLRRSNGKDPMVEASLRLSYYYALP